MLSRRKITLIRFRPWPFFMRPRKWEYNQDLCDTVQMLGNERGSRSQRRKISAPMKSWGLAFTCDTYSDALCLNKGAGGGYTLIILYKRHQLPFQKQMGRLHSPSSVTGQHLPWNSAAGLTLVLFCPPLVPCLSTTGFRKLGILLRENC